MAKYDVPALRDRLARAFPFSIIPRHTDSEHYYEREDTGRVAASVSTKLSFVAKTYLFKWYVKQTIEYIRAEAGRLGGELDAVLNESSRAGMRSRDEAARAGTSAHDAIDQYVTAWIETGTRPGSAVSFLGGGGELQPQIGEVGACRSFERFIDENEIIPLASELKCWYEEGKDVYAGTVDSVLLVLSPRKQRTGESGVVALDRMPHVAHDYVVQDTGVFWCATCGRECDAKLILGDWKTSNSIRDKDDYGHQTEAYARAIEKATGLKFDDVWIIRFEKTCPEYEICRIADRKQAWKEWLAISRAYDAKHERGETPLLEPLQSKEVIRI